MDSCLGSSSRDHQFLQAFSYDYLSLLITSKVTPWRQDDEYWKAVHDLRLPAPNYSSNLMHDVGEHILVCSGLFEPWIESADWRVAANAMIVLCGRINRMISGQLKRHLTEFRDKGGFTENLTQTRLEARQHIAEKEGAPRCPRCGKPMLRRTIKKGSRQGEQFWGCPDYPKCDGAR